MVHGVRFFGLLGPWSERLDYMVHAVRQFGLHGPRNETVWFVYPKQ